MLIFGACHWPPNSADAAVPRTSVALMDVNCGSTCGRSILESSETTSRSVVFCRPQSKEHQ